jgi:hypothetical protein
MFARKNKRSPLGCCQEEVSITTITISYIEVNKDKIAYPSLSALTINLDWLWGYQIVGFVCG